MKKFTILAAIAVFVFGACSKHDVKQKDTHVIGFGTYVPGSTKAATGSILTGTNFVGGSKINVYAWNTGLNSFAHTSTAPAFMKNDGEAGNGTVVTLDATNPGGTPSSDYKPVKFWPSDETNNKLSFIGFYPAGPTPGYTLTWTTASNVVEGNITVSTTSAEQIDFMVSDVANDKTYTNTSGNVALKFHHLMTQINVKVKTDDATDAFLGAEGSVPTLTVNSLSFSSIYDKAKLTTTYDASSSSSTHTMAVHGTSTATYDFSPSSGIDLKGTSTAAKYLPSGATSLTAPGDAYLLVPQTLVADSQKVSVTYTITYPDGTPPETVTVTKDLRTATLSSWGKNKKIVYTFTIGLKPITFTSDLYDWDDVTSESITL